ncbi:MAPEG family protein [Gymnodinialimonas sp. 2305UL16-5]|uniref:MAPEG family protein n=1 Tax=Gymnodinialimonas mytili TaxID=3126503 RepID=UPI0030AC4E88
MSSEILALAVIAILAASMWIPYIVGVNTAEPDSAARIDAGDFKRPADPSLQRPWVHRAYRAHLNLLEQGMPFAVLILIAHMLSVSSSATVLAAWAFVTLRGVHALGMITGLTGFPARPIIFTAGWLCCVVIFVEILRLG